jgi:hypothetical protein
VVFLVKARLNTATTKVGILLKCYHVLWLWYCGHRLATGTSLCTIANHGVSSYFFTKLTQTPPKYALISEKLPTTVISDDGVGYFLDGTAIKQPFPAIVSQVKQGQRIKPKQVVTLNMNICLCLRVCACEPTRVWQW